MFKQFYVSMQRLKPVAAALALLVLAALIGSELLAQGTPAQQQQQTPSQQQKKPETPGEAGGPAGDIGPIAVPKKTEEPPPDVPKPKSPTANTPTFSMSVDTSLVTVPVSVLTKDGHFVPGLKKDMFKVMEDGVPQNVSQFTQQADAPITAVLLVEFANNNYFWQFMINSLQASYTFAQSLKKDDWVAVIAYDMRPEILADFTQDKRAVYAALGRLRPQTAGFSETNLFDALYDTIDRLQGIEGRKYIVLVSSGCDSFSKINYDKVRKKVESAKDIVIYPVSTGQAIRLYAEANNFMAYLPCTQGGMVTPGPMGEATNRVDFLQADNQMNTFARMTGGRAYFPRFEAEFPEIFQDIASSIRNQYVLAYKPSNVKQDGSFRKLKVELLGPDGKPLKMKDEKGKDVKYQILAREGYTAKHEVE